MPPKPNPAWHEDPVRLMRRRIHRLEPETGIELTEFGVQVYRGGGCGNAYTVIEIATGKRYAFNWIASDWDLEKKVVTFLLTRPQETGEPENRETGEPANREQRTGSRHLTPYQRGELIRRIVKGEHNSKIARELGIATVTVRRWRNRMGDVSDDV